MPGQSTDKLGFPEEGKMFSLTDFQGINTKSPRVSIEDNEFSWLENFFPIGKGNCRLLWGKGSNIYTAVGKTIVMIFGWHSGTNGYIIMIFSDGTAIQVNTATMATATLSASANTFYNGGNLPSLAAWSSNGVVILSSTSSNGYYAWDGSTLFSPGGNAPSWLSGLTAALTPTGNTHSNTTVDTISNMSGIQVGMTVTSSASDIPANTVVQSVNVAGSSIVISNAATGSNTGVTLTFNWSMPTGIKGTAIEIYQNRVWAANGNVVSFSAPSNGAYFGTALGGGSFTLTDSFVQSVTALKQANGYLYIFADSGINYIGNVQTTVSGGTTTTTFNNLNTDPQTGTPWASSVIPYGRAIMMASTSGVYAMFGGSAEKVSDKLDGIFSNAITSGTLPLTGLTNLPVGAVATIYGIRVFMILITTVDPFSGSTRPILCMWDGNKWFLGSQENVPTYITTLEVSSNLTAWATDGTNVFQMFEQSSSTLTKKLKTKQWSGENAFMNKQQLRVYSIGFDNSGSGFSITANIDTENGSISCPSNANAGGMIVFKATAGALQFQSSTGNINFTVPGLSINGFDNTGGVYGKFMGLSFSTTSLDFTLVETAILHKDYNFFG